MNSLFSKYAAVAIFAVSPALFMGCASDQHEIPASAMMMNDAHGDITVTAPHAGTVYVYDKNDNKLLYSGKVSRDDVIRLDEQSGNIDINDRVASSKALNNDHEHQVYFDKAPGSDARQATYVEPNGDTTVITHDDNGTHETVVAPN
jgi:hypothetical protein